MTTRPRRATLAAATLLLGLALAGCSDGPEKKTVDLEPRATTAAPSGGPTTAAPREIPQLPADDQFVRGLDPARSEEERAVTARWFEYREEVSRMLREVDVDRTLLGSLARGDGFDLPVRYVEQMQAAGTHNRGGTIASVHRVTVTGEKAVVEGCLRSTMIEVDQKQRPVEAMERFLRVRDTLEKNGPEWRVVGRENFDIGQDCRYR